MDYKEFRKKDEELLREVSVLRSTYFMEMQDRYKKYMYKKVKVTHGSDVITCFWGGWRFPDDYTMEPVLFKENEDGEESCFHESTWGMDPGSIKVELA